MKLNKKISNYLAIRKQEDTYWVEELKLNFSTQIEQRRQSQNLSYSDLAKKLGTSAAYISKIFRGDANLTIESMVKLSRATGGRVSLNILDEKITVNPSYWFAQTTRPLHASNTAYTDNAHVKSIDIKEKTAA